MKHRDTTTINITKKLRSELDKLGNIHEQTYNQILQELVREHKDKNRK